MTTGGEGGMVTTNDESLWRTMWAFKDHGKSYAAVYERQQPSGFRWLHESFGTNWRMSEIQGAIGRIQLRRMANWSAARQMNARKIINALQPFTKTGGIINCPVLDESGGSRHAYYKLYAYVKPQNLACGWSRDRLIRAICEQGVPCYQGSCSEVYLEKSFDDTGWAPARRLPQAKLLGETSLMFLVHPTLQTHELDKLERVVGQVFKEATR